MKGRPLPIFAVVLLLAASNFAFAKEEAARFEFRFPHRAAFQIEPGAMRAAFATNAAPAWLSAAPENGSTNRVELSSRIVVQRRDGASFDGLIAGRPLKLARKVTPNTLIVEAPDALTAAREAQRLAALPEALAGYPVLRRQAGLDGPYASLPTDINFVNQWPLERRDGNGAPTGVDLNVRAAWPFSTGQGVTIAVADTGIELTHVELASRVSAGPHYNFAADDTNAGPVSDGLSGAHGTQIAGLAAAQMNNARMVGVAPGANLASWVIFMPNFALATDEQLMDMFQYQSNVVAVQSHSWGNIGTPLDGPTALEQIGIANAISHGRAGRGVIMVRSAGNQRTLGGNANDDGYSSDPRVIAVGAVRFDGRVATYSEPGACVLVCAPSGDSAAGLNGLFSTDLTGSSRGVNQLMFCFPWEPDCPNKDLSDYVFDAFGFSGTSASVPQIAGITALILGANPNLTYRDVQQILILAARQFDPADPDLVQNGAGLKVSHNAGFGVPDAGVAVQLARAWVNRPALANLSLTATNQAAIPDGGLRVWISGSGVPAELTSVSALPSVGPHADVPTPLVPLADFGFGTNLSGYNLTNKAALIQRDTNATFDTKIRLAAQAGAVFAVVYNFSSNTPSSGAPGGEQLIPMGSTDYVPIPAVFIGHSHGEALKGLFSTNSSALAQIRLNSTSYVFSVSQQLLCEHVGVRIKTDHELRGDLRITLVSPAGTRSVLQRYNADENPGPVDWTYYSTHHFLESSAGPWTVYFTDELAEAAGSVLEVSLQLSGVAIVDTDEDGLDDGWEISHFANLNPEPKADPDRDGYSNAREQLMGTDPNAPGEPFPLDLSRWNETLARLSWPGSSNYTYEISAGTNPAALSVVTNVPGRWPDTEWFTPYNNSAHQFFRVRAIALP